MSYQLFSLPTASLPLVFRLIYMSYDMFLVLYVILRALNLSDYPHPAGRTSKRFEDTISGTFWWWSRRFLLTVLHPQERSRLPIDKKEDVYRYQPPLRSMRLCPYKNPLRIAERQGVSPLLVISHIQCCF